MLKDSAWLDEEYEVKKIVNKRISEETHRLMYKVKWKGHVKHTWEYFKNLGGCLEAIELYEVKHFTNETAHKSRNRRKK